MEWIGSTQFQIVWPNVHTFSQNMAEDESSQICKEPAEHSHIHNFDHPRLCLHRTRIFRIHRIGWCLNPIVMGTASPNSFRTSVNFYFFLFWPLFFSTGNHLLHRWRATKPTLPRSCQRQAFERRRLTLAWALWNATVSNVIGRLGQSTTLSAWNWLQLCLLFFWSEQAIIFWIPGCSKSLSTLLTETCCQLPTRPGRQDVTVHMEPGV